MTEASSISNVRIINNASIAEKISPRPYVFAFTIILTLLVYFILLARHFLGNKISNLDALGDYVARKI